MTINLRLPYFWKGKIRCLCSFKANSNFFNRNIFLVVSLTRKSLSRSDQAREEFCFFNLKRFVCRSASTGCRESFWKNQSLGVKVCPSSWFRSAQPGVISCISFGIPRWPQLTFFIWFKDSSRPRKKSPSLLFFMPLHLKSRKAI